MTQAQQRIAKVMAQAGLCSRREAEAWILAGRVQVDGKILTTPALVVTDANQILIDQKPFRWPQAKSKIWIYHKPDGLLVTNRDPEGRPTIFDNLPKSLPRVVAVGRLDLNSEGLLLLTNDGALARYLELPRSALARYYRVRVYGNLPLDLVEKLAQGLRIDGVDYAPIELEIEKITGRNAWLYMTLREGKNREIRKVLAHFELQVNRLIRLAYGPFRLDKLPPGQVEEINSELLPKMLPDYFNARPGKTTMADSAAAPSKNFPRRDQAAGKKKFQPFRPKPGQAKAKSQGRSKPGARGKRG
jgi:23S rRNA pseudouridine2605 synthase